MSLTVNFATGNRVIYVPGVAKGDPKHEACERGTVSSVNNYYVFVRFDDQVKKLGWDGATSCCCDPVDLRLEDSV